MDSRGIDHGMITLGNVGIGGKSLPLDTVDNKGVVWWVGTSRETSSFANPHLAGSMTASWIGNGTGVPSDTINRVAANTHTSNAANAWWKLDISTTGNRLLAPTYMRVQSRAGYNDQAINTAAIEASNDDTNWTTIGGVTPGQVSPASGTWSTIQLTPIYGAFRYFRFTLTSLNASGYWYLCLCEYELFGTLYE
jgi:hypothetical protein